MEEAASASSKVQENLRVQDQTHQHTCPHPMMIQGSNLILSMLALLEEMMNTALLPLQPCLFTIRFRLMVSADDLHLQMKLSLKGDTEALWLTQHALT